MEFSDDYSPIIDLKEKIGREIAFPFLESTVSSVLSTWTDQLFTKKSLFFRKWKNVTVVLSRVEKKKVDNWCFVAAHKARLAQKCIKELIRSQLCRGFWQVLLAAEAAQLECEKDANEILRVKTEIEALKNENLKEKEKLLGVKEKLSKGLQNNPEFVINEMKMLKEENSQLHDKLLTYEIHFGSYLRETEHLLRSYKVSTR